MNRQTTTRTANGGAPARSASGSAAGQREKVTFPANATQFVTLEFDDGQEVAGRAGPQAQYFLVDNRIMWVDPEISEAIWNTGARAGDTVAITKRETHADGKKAVQWEVAMVEDETEQPAPRNEPDERAAAYVRAMPQAPRAAATPAPASDPAIWRPGSTPASPPDPRIEELRNLLTRPAATAQEGICWGKPEDQATDTAAKTNAPNQMAACMCAAIRAASYAEQFGARIGKTVAFSTDDIRAMANTLYISASRGNA